MRDYIGFSKITKDEILKHLVITRLITPGSKLKVIEYLKRYRNIDIDIMKIRFTNGLFFVIQIIIQNK